MKRLFASIAISLYSVVVMAQVQNNIEKVKLSSDQLHEDFALMREILQTIHPALYDFVPEGKLVQELDSTRGLLDKSMTVLEMYKNIAPVVFKLGCGHTSIGLPLSEDSYINRFFPFRLKFLNGRAYIVETEERSLPLIGDEILEINKVPVATVIDQVFRFTNTDGINTANRYMWLDRKFDLYYGLHVGQPDTFTFKLKTKFQNDSTIVLPALAQRVALKKKIGTNNVSNKQLLPFYLKLENPNTAVLTIDKFFVNETFDEKIYSKFLDSCFTLIKKINIKNLVIDLRQNPGGYGTWGAWLYAYLTDKPFRYYKEALAATDKQTLPFLQYTDWKEAEYRDYAKDIVKTASGTYQWNLHENLKLQYPRNNNFSGPVYILISRKCFSTTAEFCAIAHSNKRATFIGEETGGGYYSINGGDMMEAVLPNSKIKLLVPLRKYLMAVEGYPYKGRGTIPDYTVVPTIREFLNGIDVEMKFAQTLIDQKNRK
jgi:hypothetical protein